MRVGLGPGGVDCRPCYVPSPGDWIVRAIVASEDGGFFSHRGVSAVSVVRAAFQNLVRGRRFSGASTITMQAVRLIEPRRRTYLQKAREAIQALRLERVMTKREILGQYMNRVPFGANFVGVEAASRGWFGCSPSELGLAEAALLAGLPQAPSRYRPDRHMAAALRRRSYVFDRMEALGMITAGQRAAAEAVRLEVRRVPRPFREPWFCDWVLRDRPGLSGDFRTTLDPVLQRGVSGLVEAHAAAERADVAAVVLSVADGAVLAMAVSGDYRDADAGQVNAASAPRSAGSTLKPFAFAAGIDAGFLTPSYVLPDVPRHFRGYRPVNFSRGFRGRVTARDALVQSLNIPAIEVVRRVGVSRFAGVLRALGLGAPSAAEHGLGLAIGSVSVRLDELANAYAALARGGEWRPLRPVAGETPREARRRVFSRGASWLVADMLSGEERSLPSLGHVADAAIPRFAWKTGTSSGFRDAWTVAWNPERVVAVWCGDKHGRAGGDGRTGLLAASPLAWRIIGVLYPSGAGPWFRRPPEVRGRLVCADSGLAPSPSCPSLVRDMYVRGVTLRTPCAVHRDGGGDLPAASGAGPRLPSARDPFRIESPPSGSRYRLLGSLPGQCVHVRVSGAAGQTVFWFVDGTLAARLDGAAPFVFALDKKGDFVITAAAETGAADQVSVSVE